MTFGNRPWLVGIYCDHSDKIVIQKASQVCITEYAIVDMFALARLGVPGLYVLPTDTWRNTFVANRIDRCIQSTPLYRKNVTAAKKDADSRGLKTFFGINWKFVGSQQRGNFYEFPAGVLIIDEFDLCDQDNIVYAYDRLAAAERPRIRMFGNPTSSGRGIAEEYEKSDQKVWQIKCPACNTWQPLSWFDNFVEQGDDGWFLRACVSSQVGGRDIPMLCRSCSKPMNRLGPGEWVATHPDREISGYQVSRLFGDVRPVIGDLFVDWQEAQYNQTKLQRFYNNILGLPYESSGNKITESDIQACMKDYTLENTCARETIAGVDVGGVLHLKISEVVDDIEITRWVGTVPNFEELDRIGRLFNVQTGVIDALPDTHSVRNFVWGDDPPGNWYMCIYHKVANTSDFKVDYKNRTVQIDRTQALDSNHAAWLQRKKVVPHGWQSLDNGQWVKQMTAPVRVEDKKRGVYVWDEGSKADHHHHADSYCHIAKRLAYGAGCGVEVL